MYTAERADVWEDHWDIRDPEGINICTVTSKEQAESLLSHLNRG